MVFHNPPRLPLAFDAKIAAGPIASNRRVTATTNRRLNACSPPMWRGRDGNQLKTLRRENGGNRAMAAAITQRESTAQVEIRL